MEIKELINKIKTEFPALRRGKSRFGKGDSWNLTVAKKKLLIAYDVELSCDGDTWRNAGLNSGALLGTGANINDNYHIDHLTEENVAHFIQKLRERIVLENQLAAVRRF